MNPKTSSLFLFLIILSLIDAVLALSVGFSYRYNASSMIEACLGAALLFLIAGGLWFYRRRSKTRGNSLALQQAIVIGMILGLLWMVEIGINNFIAPPLPARDIIDNLFWIVIALSILIFAVLQAYQTGSIVHGIEVGTWSGFVSGMLACCMALVMVVFGMRFIMQDPLNIAEWAGQQAVSPAPGMAAYFAFETFAGALGHLTILGIGMGALLGGAAGMLGVGGRRLSQRVRGLHQNR